MTAAPPVETYWPVSAHAVLRWLTRVENFDLRPVVAQLGRDAGNWPIARAACEAYGVPIEAVQRYILPPELLPAIKAGAERIRRQGMVLIVRNSVVVTLTDEVHSQRRRIMTKRELNKSSQRICRRKKR